MWQTTYLPHSCHISATVATLPATLQSCNSTSELKEKPLKPFELKGFMMARRRGLEPLTYRSVVLVPRHTNEYFIPKPWLIPTVNSVFLKCGRYTNSYLIPVGFTACHILPQISAQIN